MSQLVFAYGSNMCSDRFRAYRVHPGRAKNGYVKLLRLIHASPWFQSRRPKDMEAVEIWKRRAAFLDAIFYE